MEKSLIEKLRKTDKCKNVPESYLKGLNLSISSDSEIENIASIVDANYKSFIDDLIENGVIDEAPSPESKGFDEAEIKAYLEDKFPSSNNEVK